jgi:hypothetical protein
MPSLINRVTSFGQSKKGQSLIQQAVGRFTGGKGSRKAGGRRRAGANRRSRVARKR